jgi:hypothetical protein
MAFSVSLYLTVEPLIASDDLEARLAAKHIIPNLSSFGNRKATPSV